MWWCAIWCCCATWWCTQACQQLKSEGNTLHSSGRYQEALEKYERAKSNVDGLGLGAGSGGEAGELRRACTLNLSSCYLNLQRWEECVAQCNEVLAGAGLRCCAPRDAVLHAVMTAVTGAASMPGTYTTC
jgi:hypothetical protein